MSIVEYSNIKGGSAYWPRITLMLVVGGDAIDKKQSSLLFVGVAQTVRAWDS